MPHPSRLDQIRDWEQQAHLAGYRANRLADSLVFTPRQLQRHILKNKGIRLKIWLYRLQMEKAMDLLRAPNPMKHEAIASEIGFRSPAQFSRRFKAYYGVSPAYAATLWQPREETLPNVRFPQVMSDFRK